MGLVQYGHRVSRPDRRAGPVLRAAIIAAASNERGSVAINTAAAAAAADAWSPLVPTWWRRNPPESEPADSGTCQKCQSGRSPSSYGQIQ
jgi:hypothetical protein